MAVETIEGFTALMCAAFFGHFDAVARLLDWGVSSGTTDGSGLTPLHCAAEQGHGRYFIDYGHRLDATYLGHIYRGA